MYICMYIVCIYICVYLCMLVSMYTLVYYITILLCTLPLILVCIPLQQYQYRCTVPSPSHHHHHQITSLSSLLSPSCSNHDHHLIIITSLPSLWIVYLRSRRGHWILSGRYAIRVGMYWITMDLGQPVYISGIDGMMSFQTSSTRICLIRIMMIDG